MSDWVDRKSSDPATILFITLGLALFAYNLIENRYFWHDDAFITLRYAINFAETGALGWNPGERVEGYTEPLHLFLISGLIRLGVEPMMAARLVNLAALILLIWAVIGTLRDLDVDRRFRAIAFTSLIAAPAVAIWLVGGLGALLAAAMVALACRVLLRSLSAVDMTRSSLWAAGAAVLAGLAYLARPDTALFFFGTMLFVLLLWDRRFASRFTLGVVFGTVFTAVVGAHILWRYGYYGEFLPNTYFAKVGVDFSTRMSRVVTYFGKSLLLYAPVISAAGLVLVLSIFVRTDRRMLILTGGAAVFGAYLLWSGGDHMPAARVFVPLIGPAAILIGIGLNIFSGLTQIIMISIVILGVAMPPLRAAAFPKDPAAYVGSIVGKYVADNWPQGSLIGLNTAGSTPYFAPGNTYIDMLGLNDRTIGKREGIVQVLPRQALPGHFKGDGAYVFSRQPDYIIAGSAEGRSLDEPWFLTGYELNRIEGFAECYQMHEVMIPYSVPEAERIDYVDNPLPFTYYQRTCPKQGE
ncbi:glycosyltransferase family 39 protein [Rhodobacteraceae bacterium NNCM2]|nr:glycosyltransferase family 39 protein [Coraliihabitans acroporae]